MAGEVSKDLTMRVLLPEEIVKAHQEGELSISMILIILRRKSITADLINLRGYAYRMELLSARQ